MATESDPKSAYQWYLPKLGEVTSGVPQGSVQGPVLFNVFINDLDEEVQGMLIKFADDTKLDGIANTLEDRNKLQSDIDRLEHWAKNNRMKFNRDACKVLHLGKRNQMHSYKMGGILGSAILQVREIVVEV